VSFGSFGISAQAPGRLTSRQIEAVRRTLKRKMRALDSSGGKIWVRVFPHTPVTAKPQEVRMGKGKGALSYWASCVKPGKVLFEISLNNEVLAHKILKSASLKLPIPTRVISKL
jgi:large subunit ribosomal protein L16